MLAPGGLQAGRAHHSDHWRMVGLSPDDLLSQGGKEAAAGPQLAEEPCTNQSTGTRQSPSLKWREQGWEEVMGTAPWLTRLEHGGKEAIPTLAPRALRPAMPPLHRQG